MNPNIYLHDNTFEGLLTAVAVAVKSQLPIQGIYPDKHYTPKLFDTTVHVESDENQAKRLIDYLAGIGGSASLYAINGYLSEDREVGTHLYCMVKECLNAGSNAISNYADKSMRYLDMLSRKVSFEAHRLSGLIRFQIFESQLQYGPFESDHVVIGYLAQHFKQRLKSQRWILHDVKRNYALYWNTEILQSIDIDTEFTRHVQINGEAPGCHFHENEAFYQDLWKSFHSAISIADKTNQNLQRQFMPVRYWKYLVEMR